jgi:hypothetical protein
MSIAGHINRDDIQEAVSASCSLSCSREGEPSRSAETGHSLRTRFDETGHLFPRFLMLSRCPVALGYAGSAVRDLGTDETTQAARQLRS